MIISNNDKGYTEVVHLLLENGAPADIRDYKGRGFN